MDTKKLYKKIKKKHIFGAVFSFIVFTVILSFILLFIAYEFAAYLVDTKLASENRSAKLMANLYDQAIKDGVEDVYSLLDEAGRSYVVTDKDGNVLHVSGEDTRGTVGGMVTTVFIKENMYIINDAERGYIYPSNNGMIFVDRNHFEKWIVDAEYLDYEYSGITAADLKNEEDVENALEDGTLDVSVTADSNTKFIDLPVWIQKYVNGGKERLIVKAEIIIDMRDLDFVGIIALILIMFVAVLLISKLVGSIVDIIRQNMVTTYFTTDYTTRGHNQMYFLIHGENTIKKRKNRKYNFGIVNLVFVNYRNYVVAHSLKEGEEMLKTIYEAIVAELNKKSLVAKRDMVAHLTSSNYALILEGETEEVIRERLETIIKKLETIDGSHKFSFQAGVSFIGDHVFEKTSHDNRKNKDINLEYSNACAARATLNESDESGIAFFGEKLVEDQKWLDNVQSKQQQAVDNEEFVIYYQPKYNPRTNELSGVEALIRWQSPEYGFVTPYRFIPIFEKNGFITEIDHYMLEHVARDQKKWLDMGYKCVPASVNVSRAHFIEDDLAEQIRDTIDKYGTPHDLVEIELTESAFFDDKKAMLETINKLKGYGFAVSMDDFGSGYSSLNSLKDMPLDVLKLDAEFFHIESSDESRGKTVVSEAIKLAKSLNMKTVAEGVEIKEQVDFLADEGCDMIQGYYYAKPMPGEEYQERMTKATEREEN